MRLTLGLGIIGVVLFVLVFLLPSNSTKEVIWEGGTDEDMLAKVRVDLAEAIVDHVKVLKVTLVSPGGPVYTALEIARLVRDTSDKTGMVIEIHAKTLCASGCTVVLASGTPGHRYISSLTLFLVHSIQTRDDKGERKCMAFIPNPKTQDEKALDMTLIILRDTYVKYTHIAPELVAQYMTCGNEQIGKGDLAVKLGFADKVD